MSRFVETALQFSRSHEYDKTLPSWMCALIVAGGRVLSVGYNQRGGNISLQEHYKINPWCDSIHSEVDAILNVRRKIDLTGSKMVVVRRLKYDTRERSALALARPCPMCEAILWAYGIKKVFYTISNTDVGVMKVTDPRTHPVDPRYKRFFEDG